MPFQNKMLENGREIIFRENKTTNKESLFVNDKVLKERDELYYIGLCQQTSNVQRMYLSG